MSRGQEHAAAVAKLRDELDTLRKQGGISDQFVDWHARMASRLVLITKDVPSCANLCAEILSIVFEISPEFADTISDTFSDNVRIIAGASVTFFRDRCAKADEILATLMIALRQAQP
jgi:hypothetical protein